MSQASTSPSSTPPADALSDALTQAQQLKTLANAHFQAARYDDAVAGYLDALALLPPRPILASQDDTQLHDDDDDESAATTETTTQTQSKHDEASVDTDSPSAVERTSFNQPATTTEPGEVTSLRTALYSNLSASYLKLSQYSDAVCCATSALSSSPHHIKALHRRSTANIHIDTLSSLSSALEDQKLLLTLPDLPPSSRPALQKSTAILEARVSELAQKEKDEMLDKFKGLGNSLLGTFGLSTDNFKFVKAEGGGYSMNFVR